MSPLSTGLIDSQSVPSSSSAAVPPSELDISFASGLQIHTLVTLECSFWSLVSSLHTQTQINNSHMNRSLLHLYPCRDLAHLQYLSRLEACHWYANRLFHCKHLCSGVFATVPISPGTKISTGQWCFCRPYSYCHVLIWCLLVLAQAPKSTEGKAYCRRSYYQWKGGRSES